MLHYLQHKIYLEFLKIWTIDKSELPRGSISRHMEVRIYSTFLWQKDQRRLFSTVKSIGHLSLLHQLLKILISDLTRPLASEKLGSQHRQQPPVAWILIGYCFRISPSFFFFPLVPAACGSFWAKDGTRPTVETWATPQHDNTGSLTHYTYIHIYLLMRFMSFLSLQKSVNQRKRFFSASVFPSSFPLDNV